VNAVDSEHEKNLMNDAWRLFQLEKATGNPNHPFSKFGTGRNPQELSLDLAEMVYHEMIQSDSMFFLFFFIVMVGCHINIRS